MGGWIVVIFWVGLGALTGALVGRNKGRGMLGFLLGLILGWLGVLIVALMSPTPEERVRRQQRDQVIAAEAARRQAGYAPWSNEPRLPGAVTDPPTGEMHPLS